MKRRLFLLIPILLATLVLLAACRGPEGQAGMIGPAGPAGPLGPIGPAGSDATASQEFIGSEQCGTCHEDIYARFVLSGHPNNLTKIEDGQPPELVSATETGGVPEPPDGYTWADIAYVVGGFGWQARFIGADGYVLTGDANSATQYNFANAVLDTRAGWVAYHPGETLPADCGRCHTTGYAPQGHQDDLAGIVGTWTFDGVQCEVCHGAGSLHAQSPYGVRMVVDRSSQLCGHCHVRDNPAMIDAADGFAQHNEQYEDLYNSRHFALSCVTCHDPHASAVFADDAVNPNKSINQTCATCHWQQTVQNVSKHASAKVACIDCHMPRMAVSAQGLPDRFSGDVRSHQFAINPDPEAAQFTADGNFVMPYITLTFACKACHNDAVYGEKSLAELATAAQGYHDRPMPTPAPEPTVEPVATPAP